MMASLFRVGQRLTDGLNVDVLVEDVKQGGFGEVAIGPDLLHEGRWSALKALRPDLLAQLGVAPGSATYGAAEARLRANFLHEALTWRGLWPHPNLLTAHSVEQINGELTLVLEYAEHGSLREWFSAAHGQGAWLPLDLALHLAQQIAAGLVALHTPAPDLLRDQPIVHCDLKPENILLSRGYAQITDFGLSKMVTEAATRAAIEAGTTPRAQGGTPAYMAPDQWQDASQVGRPADAYAFGLIVAELLTGRHPLLPLELRHPQADWRAAHLAGRPIPLRQLGAEVFANERASRDAEWGARQEAALAQVEVLVARLLAKLTAARPTVAEALTALQAAAVTLGEDPYTPSEDFYPPTEEHQQIFWRGWADAYRRFGLHEEALALVERVRAHAPQDPKMLTSYAIILDGLGKREEALAVERQALALTSEGDDRERATRWSNIGVTLGGLGSYAEAEAAFAEATRLSPTLAGAWRNQAALAGKRALAEWRAGRVEAAQTHVEAGLAYIAKALQLNPDHQDYLMFAQTLLQMRERLRGQG